jgi:hypothetical protein
MPKLLADAGITFATGMIAQFLINNYLMPKGPSGKREQ